MSATLFHKHCCHESVQAASLGSCGRDGGGQAMTVGVETAIETAILRVERFVTFSVFGVYS